jgi:hypothetical protein
MPLSNQVFLGCENGEVLSFNPATSDVHVLTRENGPILSLHVDSRNTYVTILSQIGTNIVCVRLVSRTVGYRTIKYKHLEVTGAAYLATPAVNCVPDFVVVCDGVNATLLKLPNLIAESGKIADEADEPTAVLCGSANSGHPPCGWWLLTFSNFRADWLAGFLRTDRWGMFSTSRVLSLGDANTLNQIPLHAVMVEDENVEITGIDAQGHLIRATFRMKSGGHVEIDAFHPLGKDRYNAFAVVRSDLLAAVHVKGVDWWTLSTKRARQTKLELKNPIAALALPESRELLVIESGGLLTRVPIVD